MEDSRSRMQQPEAASATDPSLSAQVTVDHPEFTLRSLGRQGPDLKLLVIEFSTRADGTAIAFVEVESEDFSAFEVSPTDTDSIVQWEIISRGDSRRLYCIHLGGLEPELRRACADLNVHVSRMVSHQEGWLLDLWVPDREALTELTAKWREAGFTFRLKRLTQTALEDRDCQFAGITPEQYELLWTAHQHGYFQIPRGVSQSDLAEELGISTSGISQRIRRAFGTLLDSVFEDERSLPPDVFRNAGR